MLVDNSLELTDVIVAEIGAESEVEIEFGLDEAVVEVYLILCGTLEVGIALTRHQRCLVDRGIEVIDAGTVYAAVVRNLDGVGVVGIIAQSDIRCEIAEIAAELACVAYEIFGRKARKFIAETCAGAEFFELETVVEIGCADRSAVYEIVLGPVGTDIVAAGSGVVVAMHEFAADIYLVPVADGPRPVELHRVLGVFQMRIGINARIGHGRIHHIEVFGLLCPLLIGGAYLV